MIWRDFAHYATYRTNNRGLREQLLFVMPMAGSRGTHESLQGIAAIIATVILVLLMYFRVVLAVWLPLGQAAWGGEHRVLPAALREGSLAAVVILGLATWMVLARANLVAPEG